MATRKAENDIRITLSVLDRLLDFEPSLSSEAAKSRAKSLRELKQSVRRDLEWLLNSRRPPIEIDENLEEVRQSLALYGLPDFTGVAAKSPSEQKRLLREIENAVKLFEPRLMDVRVSLEPPSATERVLKFRIEARLKVEPTPEPVTFDTVLQLGSGEYQIKEV